MKKEYDFSKMKKLKNPYPGMKKAIEPAEKKEKTLTTKEFDAFFDKNKDITSYLDMKKARVVVPD